MRYFLYKNKICIEKDPYFDLRKTLLCGQCFRFEEVSKNNFCGVVSGKVLKVSEEQGKIHFETSQADFKNFWTDYFDLNSNYESLCSKIISINENLKKPLEYSRGIRILKQDSWEALCSFIFSQNNRIPRIVAIIKSFCENFGEKIKDELYSFPKEDVVAKLTPKDLKVTKCGFRSQYILDAAKKTVSGEIVLESLRQKPLEEAKKILMKIQGVGEKVASCTLLYGLNRLDAFPIDTWIKRSMGLFFVDKSPCELGLLSGIAQQHIYHWARNKQTAHGFKNMFLQTT